MARDAATGDRVNGPGATAQPASQGRPVLTRSFVLIMSAQATFGFAWSIYFLVPKYVTTAYGAGPAVVGRLTAVSGIASMLAVPMIGALIDRYGRRRWMTVGSALLVMAACGFLLADGVGPLLYLAQILQGLAFVFVFNAAGTLVADSAPPERLAQAIGLFGVANLSMNAVAPATAEVVAVAHGWPAVFGISGAVALLSMLVSRAVPEPARPGHTVSRQEATSVALAGPLLRVYAASAAMAVSFASLLILHQPMAIAAGVTEVRGFFVGFTATAIAVRVLFGRVTDRVGTRRVAIASMSLYCFVPGLMVVLGPSHLLWVGGALGLCHGALYPAVTALGLERCAPSSRGMVLSLLNGAFNGGVALASLVLGELASRAGYPAAFGASALITGVGAFLLVGVPPGPSGTGAPDLEVSAGG